VNEQQDEIDQLHEHMAATEARMTWETHQGMDVAKIKAEVEDMRKRLAELRAAQKARL